MTAKVGNISSSSSLKTKKAVQPDIDPWSVTGAELLDERLHSWKDTIHLEKFERILWAIFRFVALLLVIFCFICTLAVLADAFKLISGRGIGDAIRHNKFVRNPISASIIGMVVTLVLQSGSTLTTILVGMVASDMLTVRQAVPMIIGSEMGASFMNTLIALGQSGNREQFRRAFAAATMNDVYNFLCYLVILPAEVAFGFIEWVGELLVEPLSHTHLTHIQTLSVLTEPVLNYIIQIDIKAINAIIEDNRSVSSHQTFVFRCVNLETREELVFCPYSHIFAHSLWSDGVIGVVLLAGAIAALIGCLIGIVRLVQSLLAGQIGVLVRNLLDRELPYPFGWFTNYLVMLVGCLIVVVVQSGSVFRSALTPLVGVGVVPLERFYALVLGANVGSTCTGVLAALSADPTQIKETMQLAMCQTVYNILGILLFYPIPQTRVPIPLSIKLGDTTAKYHWFAYAYIFTVFFAVPSLFVGLSFFPSEVMLTLLGGVFALICLAILLNFFQKRCPRALPRRLRTWRFLPEVLRSLQPYDRYMSLLCARLPCRSCRKTGTVDISKKNFTTTSLQNGMMPAIFRQTQV